MFVEATFSDVVPLRAIAFQILFLLVAIAIEAFVLHRYLEIDYKTSVRYAATINLFSTFVGWLIFFGVEPLLPFDQQTQFISYIFFEQIFPASQLSGLSSFVIILSLVAFLGTFLIKWQGLEFLEFLLEKRPKPEAEADETPRFRGRDHQLRGIRVNSRSYAVFVANSASFSAILLLLFLRLLDQIYLMP